MRDDRLLPASPAAGQGARELALTVCRPDPGPRDADARRRRSWFGSHQRRFRLAHGGVLLPGVRLPDRRAGLKPSFNLVDRGVRCGGARRKSNRLDALKPVGAEVLRGLDLVDTQAKPATRIGKFASVVAPGSPDDDDDVSLARKFDGGLLPLLGWLADRVLKPDFGVGKTTAQQFQQVMNAFGRLRGLRGHSKFRALSKLLDIPLRQDDIEFGEVFRQTANLDMIPFADDDRVEILVNELLNRAVGVVNERTGCFCHGESLTPKVVHRAFGRAVGRDHHITSLHLRRVILKGDPVLPKNRQYGVIVDEVTENGQRPRVRSIKGQRDCVLDPEAHAQVFGSKYSHSLVAGKGC